jgi:mercuric ion transport protein
MSGFAGIGMKDRALLKIGLTGSIVAAVCCFTPALVVLFGAVGLTAWVGWLDFVLFPALALFILVTSYAVIRIARAQQKRGMDAP